LKRNSGRRFACANALLDLAFRRRLHVRHHNFAIFIQLGAGGDFQTPLFLKVRDHLCGFQVLVFAEVHLPVIADSASDDMDMLPFCIIMNVDGERMLICKTHLVHVVGGDLGKPIFADFLTGRKPQGIMPNRFFNIRALISGADELCGKSINILTDHVPTNQPTLFHVRRIAINTIREQVFET
jgi:hypothetical protein